MFKYVTIPQYLNRMHAKVAATVSSFLFALRRAEGRFLGAAGDASV